MIYWLPAIKKLSEFCAIFFAFLVLVTCLGCQTGGINLPNISSGNATSVSDDLIALVNEQAKATLYEPRSYTVGNKLLICEFKAFPQDINTIANAFDMTEIKSDKTLKYIHYNEKNSHLGGLFSQGKKVRAYGVFGPTAKLKCKNGKAFEYMLIFYRPETNEASIETSVLNG